MAMNDDDGYPPLRAEKREPGVRQYWFGEKTSSGWIVEPPDPDSLLVRLGRYPQGTMSAPCVSDAVASGFCRDKSDYYKIMRELCIAWSKETIKTYCSSDEARLIKLVLILRETDRMMSRVSEQIAVWESMVCLADLDCGYNSEERYGRKNGSTPADDGISLLSEDIVRMKGSRAEIARDIAKRSEALLPNCSALVGPLVAARLLAEAGGLTRLAQMPASAIQILGAKTAFFSHRVSGSPPPKHGCIYEHKRVHAAPKRVRGKVSRTLAACLAIAARIDCHRGSGDPVFLQRAKKRIDMAGGQR